MAREINPYLEQLTQAFWLRPETALWRCFDSLYMEKYGKISGNSADMGCGDGVMSYIMAGGQLKDFDVFNDVADLASYNDGADIFNCTPENPLVMDNSTLRYEYNRGLDQKNGLVDKAKRLSPFYQSTAVHDLNQPLPKDIGTLDSMFTNILYWLDDPVAVLQEWGKSLSSGGHINIMVPGKLFREKAWLYYSAPHSGDKRYLNYFDRGYGPLIKHCYDSAKWSNIFEEAGYGVVTQRAYLSDPVIDIWNIGTRPISPLLINMASKLDGADRLEVKQEWMDYFINFFQPIIEGEFDRDVAEDQTAFHFFVIEKK